MDDAALGLFEELQKAGADERATQAFISRNVPNTQHVVRAAIAEFSKIYLGRVTADA